MRIAKVHTSDRAVNQLQDNIIQGIKPILSNPLIRGVLLKSLTLVSGSNQIKHGLGRELQGWVPVRVRGAATFYDTQDSNATPTMTLTLVSSAAVTIDIYVF